jgi:hypothetical protein
MMKLAAVDGRAHESETRVGVVWGEIDSICNVGTLFV